METSPPKYSFSSARICLMHEAKEINERFFNNEKCRLAFVSSLKYRIYNSVVNLTRHLSILTPWI